MIRLLPRLALLCLLWPSLALAQATPSVQGAVSYYAVVADAAPAPEFRVLVNGTWSQPDPGPACPGGPNWVFADKAAANYDLVVQSVMQAAAHNKEVQIWTTAVTIPGGTFCRIDYIRVWGVGRF